MSKVRLVINFLLIAIFSLSCFIGYSYFWPGKISHDTFSITINDVDAIDNLMDNRFMATLIWNERVRLGEHGNLQIEFCLERDYQQKIAGGDYFLQEKPQNQLMINAKIVLPGINTNPGNEYIQAYHQKCNKFQWILMPDEPGIYGGKLWLYIFPEKNTETRLEKVPILARDIVIESYVPLNIPRQLAYVICTLGIFALVTLVFEFLRYKH